jgi:hypothetical protein
LHKKNLAGKKRMLNSFLQTGVKTQISKLWQQVTGLRKRSHYTPKPVVPPTERSITELLIRVMLSVATLTLKEG